MDYMDTDRGYTLLNTVDDIAVWKDNDIKVYNYCYYYIIINPRIG